MIEVVQVTYATGVVHTIHGEQLTPFTLEQVFDRAGIRREGERRELARDLMGDITYGTKPLIVYSLPDGPITVERKLTQPTRVWDVPMPTWVDKAGLRPLAKAWVSHPGAVLGSVVLAATLFGFAVGAPW